MGGTSAGGEGWCACHCLSCVIIEACSTELSEEIKASCPEVRDCGPAFCPALSSRDPEFYYLMVATVKAAPDFHIPSQFFVLCKQQVQQSTSSC